MSQPYYLTGFIANDIPGVTHQAQEYILAELSKTCKAKKLKGFEAIRGVLLRSQPFAVDDDTMCVSPLVYKYDYTVNCLL